jgi:type I restriction enzyme, S subunit
MKEGWSRRKLSELFTIRPQKKQSKEKLNDNEEVSFVPMECLNVYDRNLTLNQTRTLKDVYSGYTYFEDNDVLLAKIAPCFENGKVGIARNLKNGIGFGSSEFFVFRPQGKGIPEYLYYYLSQESFRQEGKAMMAGAVGHKRVSKDFINEYQLPFPESIQEQKRIVAILDEAFAAIDKAKDNAEKNLANAKELFESYLNGIFANPGEDWEEKNVSELCESITDCLNRTAPTVSHQTLFKMIRTSNIRNGCVSLENVRYVTEDIYSKWTRRKIPKPGDLLFTREAPMGEIGILNEQNTFIGQRIVSYRVNTKIVNNIFLYFYFRSNAIKHQVLKMASGATVQHLRVPDTKKIIFYILNLKVQNKIVNLLEKLLAETKALEFIYKKRIATLEELKESILKKAFEGEL